MKVFVPPIKCQGIKTKLIPWIKQYVDIASTGCWIEPFMGSGVVGFNIRPTRAIFADINPHIINFYNSIKNGYVTPNKAKLFLEKEGSVLSLKGEEYYYSVRERFNKDGDPFDFLFLTRSCFNGVMRFNRKGGYNVPFGHKPERFAKSYVTKIVNQIKYVETAINQYDWTFICSDFRVLIPNSTNNDFFYFDPPYAGRNTDYYNSWSDEDEDELFNKLTSIQGKFILSTWHSNRYRYNTVLDKHNTLFNTFIKEHFYHVGANEENRHPMLEAIVLNYMPIIHSEKTEDQIEIPVQLKLLEEKSQYL